MATSSERLAVLIEANTKSYENAMRRIEQTTNQAIRSSQASVKRLDTSMRGISNTVTLVSRAFTGAFVGGAATAAISRLADTWTQAGNKIAAAGEVAGRAGRPLQDINKIATDTRTGITATVDLYAKLLRSTKDVAQSEQEVARATEIVNKAFKAGGAAVSEQTAGILQLAQGLGSGNLQGDELRSIRENAPLLAQAIADEFQTTIAGLKKLGAEGELTSDRIFGAILRGAPQIERAFGRTESTISDAMTLVGNAFAEAAGELDDLTGSSENLVAALEAVASGIRNIRENATWTADKIEAFRELMLSLGLLPDESIQRKLERMGHTVEDIQLKRLQGELKEATTRSDEFRVAWALARQELEQLQAALASGQSGVIGKIAEAREQAELLRGRFNDANKEVRALREQLNQLSTIRYDPLSSISVPSGLPTMAAQQAALLQSRYGTKVASQPPQTSDMTAQLIAGFEDFRSTPYWDVNHWRVGYGSDTMTDAMGQISEVTQQSVTTVADATRDLIRRIADIQAEIVSEVGQQSWDALTEEAKAAVTSAVYNYGSLSKTGLAPAIYSGDPLAIAAQLESLQGHNEGVNRKRRLTEAALAAGEGGKDLYEKQLDAIKASAKAAEDAAEDAKQKQEELDQATADFEKTLTREGQALKLQSDALRQSTAEAEYAAEKQRLTNELTDAGIEITDDYARAIEDLAQRSAALVVAGEQRDLELERQQESMDASIAKADELRSLSNDVLGGLVSDLANGVKPAEALANALGKIAQKLIDIGVNALTESLFGPVGSSLGGIFGSLFAPAAAVATAHSGGIVGSPMPSRLVPAAMFAGAPRYHSGGIAGLQPGEVPIIAQQGETIIPRGGNRSLGQMRSASRQRVDVDNVVHIRPSPEFEAKVDQRVRQGQAETLAAVPGYLGQRQRRGMR